MNPQADRPTFDQVRFLGNQDTLLLQSASTTAGRRLLPRLLRRG